MKVNTLPLPRGTHTEADVGDEKGFLLLRSPFKRRGAGSRERAIFLVVERF